MKEKYIKAAKAACAHVYKTCPLGSSNRHNGTSYEDRYAATTALIEAKLDFYERVAEIQSKLDDELQQNFAIIQLLAEIAEKAKAGNCQEMAAVAFLFLMNMGISIELVSIPTHTFLIIGRSPLTPIHDPSRWNDDTIICDPWRKKHKYVDSTLYSKESNVYSPSRLLEKLGKMGCEKLRVGYTHYAASDVEEATSAAAPHSK